MGEEVSGGRGGWCWVGEEVSGGRGGWCWVGEEVGGVGGWFGGISLPLGLCSLACCIPPDSAGRGRTTAWRCVKSCTYIAYGGVNWARCGIMP